MPVSPAAPPARSPFWDIVRGIGIVSIVMGHCFSGSIPYVYTYHLAIFFFVSGFLYSDRKYSRDPFAHIGAKLKSSWPKYMFYMTVFTLLHNPFQALGINPAAGNYSPSQTLVQLANALILNGVESMGGALWFVPTWVLACAVFGGIIWFSFRFFSENLFSEKAGGKLFCCLAVALGGLFLSFLGAYFMLHEYFFIYNVHLVLLVQVFFAAGWLLKTCLPGFKLLLKGWAAAVCALVLAVLVNVYQLYFDLAMGRIGNGWQYFFLAFLGIYCCLYLALLLEKTKKIGQFFALWGKHSFDIMALHFLVFKLIDGIYGRVFHYPIEYYSAFPHSFGKLLWPVYVLLGTSLPALAAHVWEKKKKQLMKAREQSL